MKVKTVLARAEVAASVAAVGVLAAPATANAAEIALFQNGASKQCLAVPNGSRVAGEVVVQWTCMSSSTPEDQRWEAVTTAHAGEFLLRNRHSGLCLAVPGGRGIQGMPLVQWGCTGGADQIWFSAGGKRMKNYATGQCLAIPGGSKKKGESVVQWPCSGDADQQWTAL